LLPLICRTTRYAVPVSANGNELGRRSGDEIRLGSSDSSGSSSLYKKLATCCRVRMQIAANGHETSEETTRHKMLGCAFHQVTSEGQLLTVIPV